MQTSLPIWQIHSEIIGTLQSGNRLVLVAPTGSGKTTQVPQMLLDAGLAGSAAPHSALRTPHSKKIVVLQPRRVAARTVAARVAWERHGRLGDEVGYQVRFDDQTSLGTRICYVTEGILLRWLQDNQALPEVGIILFDEFHERNLLSDVALALAKQLQQTERPDLKIIVMSATLEAKPVAVYLSSGARKDSHSAIAPGQDPEENQARDNAEVVPGQPCPILISEGQSFPVEARYLDHRDPRPAPEQAADAVERIVNSGAEGDILVFMPGMGEINATINALRAARTQEHLAFIPLHGDLPPEDQDRAFAPHPLRKVVVATNVAETSVTIDGIRHVVDGGLARIARYDAERGINTLFVEEISRASAEQRKGRAGRTAPGTCYRLWTESGHLNRSERNTPEIQRADLAEVVLLLHSLGVRKAAEFDWLDKPDPQAVERAEQLLITLGALQERGVPSAECGRPDAASPAPTQDQTPEIKQSDLTPIGRQMLRLPMHPRYSRLMVEAARRHCVPAAALCAALVSGRDLLMRLGREDKHIAEARELFEGSQESDFFTLMRAFQFAKKNNFSVEPCRRYGIHAQTAHQVEQTFEQILDIAGKQRLAESRAPGLERESPPDDAEGTGPDDGAKRPTPRANLKSEDPLLRCLMAGFIDQLCVRRNLGTLECDLTEGRTGTLMRESVVQNAPLFVAASIREVSARGSENLTLLGLATAVKREWIEEMFPQHLITRIEHLFDRTHKRVAAVRLARFRDLVIHYEHQSETEPRASGRCLAEAYRKGWFELPLLSHEIKQFIARVNLVCAVMPELEFPPMDEAAIRACLGRAFEGLTLAKEAQATPVKEAFWQHLAKEQAGWLDELAPLTISWPDGRKLKLLYVEPALDKEGKPNPPELQVKLQECFALQEHPRLCEGRLPVKFWLCSPDGRRLESTCNWPAFKTAGYPKLRPGLRAKYPNVTWF
ncbi:MAG: ATP-dependent RNA helicase [Chloroflexi bacterium]|nr:ATP-dependent RNA helicase [Chloroflexota bacterium]